MSRKYYLLPADKCEFAVRQYDENREAALTSKRAMWAKYGCSGILLSGKYGIGLTSQHPPPDRAGFKVPRRQENVWVQEPKKNSTIGKACQAELDACAVLQDLWQWSIERSLGVYVSVFSYRPIKGFHMTVSRILADGSVMLSVPDHKDALALIPSYAQELTDSEYLERSHQPMWSGEGRLEDMPL